MNDHTIRSDMVTRDDADRLTPRQRTVLDSITDSIRTRGYPPSVREIGQTADLSSTTSVIRHLRTLERKGFLNRDASRTRSYAPTARALALATATQPTASDDCPTKGVEEIRREAAVAWVPLVVRFTAGTPHQAGPQVQEVLPMPRQVVGEGELVAMTMRGPSMTDAGIHDGDILTVRRQRVAAHGDIVAALLDGEAGEATARKLQVTADGIWLLPCSPAFTPAPLTSRTAILGKVVAVLRAL